MKKIITLFLCVMVLGQPNFVLAAGKQAESEGALALEVFQMAQSLDELTSLLKAQQTKQNEYQKLQAVISYLSFRSRSIEARQMELRYKHEQRDRIESVIEKIEEDPEGWDEQFKANQANRSLSQPGQLKPSEERLKLLKERLKNLNRDIFDQETEIQNAKSELVTFESYVQGKLGLIE